MSRKAFALAAFMTLAVPGLAHADPILTPLLTAAFANTALAGGITLGTTLVTYASIAAYAVTAGAALRLTVLGKRQ